MEDRNPPTFALHQASLAAVQQRLLALSSLAQPGATQRASAVRSGATEVSGRSR
jgi:hypothetical protein